MMINSQ